MNESFITLGQLPDETEIARYMSFDKFFHLMEFRKAFLPSIRTLRSAPGSQGDALEGVWSAVDLFVRNGGARLLDYVVNQCLPAEGGKNENNINEIHAGEATIKTPFGNSLEETYGSDLEKMAAWVDVWCWNAFSYETIDMWRAYGSHPGSIMIKSTAGALRDSLSIGSECILLVEDVVYSDRNGGVADYKGEYSVFLQKSQAYKNEQEIRALVLNPEDDFKAETDRAGRVVPVDIKKLVHDVVPHYQTPMWMVEAIDAVSLRAIGKKTSISSIRKEIEDIEMMKGFFQ